MLDHYRNNKNIWFRVTKQRWYFFKRSDQESQRMNADFYNLRLSFSNEVLIQNNSVTIVCSWMFIQIFVIKLR